MKKICVDVILFSLLLVGGLLCQAATNDLKTTLSVGTNGFVHLMVDGAIGEYVVERSDDLIAGSWQALYRVGSEDGTAEFNDPAETNSTAKFYRITSLVFTNSIYLTGEFAVALDSTLNFADLQSAFGLSFDPANAVIPNAEDLSSSLRDARVYTATIAALSKMAGDIGDSFISVPENVGFADFSIEPTAADIGFADLPIEPTTADIVAALASDLSDGKLDGRNDGFPIEIGSTGEFLPYYTEQDFIDSMTEVKSDIPGIYNVAFNSVGDGTFTSSAFGNWNLFYWDAADWQ